MAIQQNFVTCTKLDVSLQALLLRARFLGSTCMAYAQTISLSRALRTMKSSPASTTGSEKGKPESKAKATAKPKPGPKKGAKSKKSPKGDEAGSEK